MKRSESTTKNRLGKPGKGVAEAPTETKTKNKTKTKVKTKSPRAAIAGGIDVGKAWLDAAVHKAPGKPLRQPNTPEGRAAIIGFFLDHEVTRVGIEASGSYEFEMVEAAREAGLEVIVFQPAQVRAYAKFLNLRAKTDPIDAALIAQCAAVQEEARDRPDPRLIPLAEHLTYLDQIGEDIARLRTRLDRYRDQRLIAGIKEEISRLTHRQRAEFALMRKQVRVHADLVERLGLLLSIDGIGEPTALTLLIRMPELGTISRERAASLAGMAPFTQKSGRWVGEAHVSGGRGRVGRALFAAAQAASQRWNKALVDLYQRLKATGAHHSVAVVACARKLVIFANTVLARGTPWATQN
jgi:transposase